MTQEEQTEKVVAPDFQQLLDQTKEDVQSKREEALLASAKRLGEIMTEDSRELKLAAAILFGLRLTRWAVSKLAEHPQMNSTMLQLVHNAQAEASGEYFDFVETFKQFKGSELPWLESCIRAEERHNEVNEARTKKLTQLIKNKNIPLPIPELDIFEDGMKHDDTLLIFAPAEALKVLCRLCVLEYHKAGGWPTALLTDATLPDVLNALPGMVKDPNQWRNTADTQGMFVEMIKAYTDGEKFSQPSGLLVVEDLDTLLASSDMLEPRAVRLVRALGMLHQYQSNTPTGLIVGIATDSDTPAGVTLGEIYPPFVLGMPHVEASMEDSELVAGSKNLKIGDEVHVLSQLQKKLYTE